MDVMEVQPAQKGKRGRKRHSDDECLTEAERVKKEKNRQAAQKCREKKEKEARDLKVRNEELERENKKLSDDKKKLEKRAQEFHRIIQDHMQKGCKLPPNVQDVYNEGQINVSSSGCSDEVELFRAVGTIEQDHTPPHTPEELSSGNMSPHARHGLRNFDGAPTALFSGTPLTEDDITRRRSCSTSRSQSSSPAPPLSPAKAGSHLPGQQKDLSYFLSHDQLPRALAPISSARVEGEEDVIHSWFSSQSRQTVPTVVSEIEEDSEDTTEYISKSYEIIGREKNTYMTVPASSSSMETAFLLPDIPSEDEVAKQLARQGHITHGEESKPNLASLGFNCIQGYSYTEDLQQVETVEEIIDYTHDVQPDNSQFVDVRKQNSSLPCTESSQVQPVVNVNVCAPALLGMCEEMSESLQQQIKTSYSAPTSSTPGRLSMSVVTQPSTNQNQQPVVTRSGQVLTQASLITKLSDTAKQQWVIGDRQQLLVSKGLHSEKDSQELISHLGSLKDEKHITTEHDNQHSQLSSIQKILHSLAMSKNLAGDNQNYAQPLNIYQMVSNLQTHLPSRKITVLSSRNGIAIARQSSEELPVQQESADQISAEASVTNILPGCAGVPMINITSPRVHALNPTSHVANLRRSSSYSSSGETTDPPAATQHHYFVKEGTRMILVNKQLPEASPSIAQAPTLVAGPNSSALPSDNTDYSENVQDLPSLNLTELNSDNNLFEKKPSRSTS